MKPTDFCNQHSACRKGLEFAETFETMAQVWDACRRPDWMFWILARTKPLTQEQYVRLAIAFAETCLQHVPAGELRPALAIQAAKNWLENPCDETKNAAADAAYAAGAYAAGAYAAADDAADDAAYAAAYAAASAAAYAADDAAHAAAYAARAADAAANCDIIRSMILNPFA